MSKVKNKTAAKMERVGTPDEVRTAFESLSETELGRLSYFARLRSRSLGYRGVASAAKYSPDALLNEALIRTLDGSKAWKIETVSLMAHLCQAMRNIANHAKERFKTDVAEPEVKLVQVVSSDANRVPYESETCGRADPEEALLDKEKDEHAEKIFSRLEAEVANDGILQDVLSGWRSDMTGPEIREVLGIDQNQLETAQRNLLRKILRISSEENGVPQ